MRRFRSALSGTGKSDSSWPETQSGWVDANLTRFLSGAWPFQLKGKNMAEAHVGPRAETSFSEGTSLQY